MCRKNVADNALLGMHDPYAPRRRPNQWLLSPDKQVRALLFRAADQPMSRLSQTTDPIQRDRRITTHPIVCSRIGYACGKIHAV